MGLDVNLSIRNKKVLIVGGGKAAQLKLGKLIAEGARITVIAPHILDSIEEQSDDCIKRTYQEGDERGYFMVVCATDDAVLNQGIVGRCEEDGQLVLNCSGSGNMRMNAVCEVDDLRIIVSGRKGNPGFSRYLAGLLSSAVDDEMLRRYRLHSQLRQILIDKKDPGKREKLSQALTLGEASLIQWIEREDDGN